MLLGWKYRLRNFISIDRYWNGKLISFRIMCEYGFDIDLRKGSFIDWILTKPEKQIFLEKWFMKRN